MGFDRVARCWRYLVLALMVACSGSAFAVTGTAPVYKEAHGYTGSTALAACQAYGSATLGANPGGTYAASASPKVDAQNMCRFAMVWSGSTFNYSGLVVLQAATCPANSVLTGSTCTCNTGYTDTGSACVNASQAAKCSAAKGGSDWFSGFTTLPTVGNTFCPSDGAASQCGTSVTGGYCTVKAGIRSCSYEVKYDGSTCTPPANSNTSAPDPCKGSSGTVNGKTVCIPLGSDPSVTVESKSTTSTSGTSGGTSTGSTSTDKATSCTGSTCTTTTTTTSTSASGTVTTSAQTKSEPKEDFCAANPQATICKESNFGGSCNASFTCNGDAIQCAMAKDQLKRNCQALDADTDTNSVTNQALSGVDKLNTEVMKADAKAGAVQVGSFNTSGRGWIRSCPADPVIAIPWARGNNTQFTIPFSRVCSPLQLLANAAVAITLLGSLAWVVGGSKAAA